jgi:hypothetical protein
MMSADPRTPRRVAECGWFARNGAVEIRLVNSCAYPAQLIVCGRAWQEAVCSAKIRARKAVELENLIRVHGEHGGGITFGTFTSGEHHLDDSLESSLAVLRHAWDGLVQRSRAYSELRKRHGIMGLVLAYEFTCGAEHGWNPHLHALWFHREPLDARGIVDLGALMYDRWEHGISSAGRYLNPRHGIKIDFNADGSALGGYVAKVQEGDWGPAQEITKGDVKTARSTGGRTPFMMLRDHYQTVYETGDLTGWDRWQEFTAAVLLGGNRSIPVCRMTPGLRKSILGDQAAPAPSEEQLAVVEVGGELIAVIWWKTWTRIRRAGLGPAVLAAGEADGLDGINALLAEHKLGQAKPPPGMGGSDEQAQHQSGEIGPAQGTPDPGGHAEYR